MDWNSLHYMYLLSEIESLKSNFNHNSSKESFKKLKVKKWENIFGEKIRVIS